MKNWEFQLGTRIRFGRGGLRKLGEAARSLGQSVLLVEYHDRSGLESVSTRARDALHQAGIDVTLFDKVPPDPDAELADEGAELARAASVDVVVAVGGGSVIDAAKGIAALARLGGRIWDYTGANPECRLVTDSLPLIAVPTTAGTGSEVSTVAVFANHGVSSTEGIPIKASMSGPAVPPTIALVDPDVTVGSPSGLTAACAADALGHAIEACMSRRANPISSTLAAQAVAMIVEYLPQAVEHPNDPIPREPLALAAMLAGAAFSHAGVTVTHALAQALGGVLHVPHGTGVAVGTPFNLRYNAESCVETYAELARHCHLPGNDSNALAQAFVECIEGLLRRVGLPETIDVSNDAPDDLIDRLVQNAKQSTPVPIKLNPRKVTDDTLRDMFTQIIRRSDEHRSKEPRSR